MGGQPIASILVIINLATASAGAALALLAQANWLLWPHVGRESFADYHEAWWHTVWWSIFPLAGVELLGVIAQLIWRPEVPAWMLWFALGLQVVAYAGTAFWWGPGQARLEQAVLPSGNLDTSYLLYLRTNWIRVAIFTVAGLLQLWIALRHFARCI